MKLVVKHGNKSIALEEVQEDATAAVSLLEDGSRAQWESAEELSEETRQDAPDQKRFFPLSRPPLSPHIQQQQQQQQQDLSSLLVDKTGVLARQQKLVFKGKVLTGSPRPLTSLGVKDGATLLLLAAAPTAGAVASPIAGTKSSIHRWIARLEPGWIWRDAAGRIPSVCAASGSRYGGMAS